MPGFTLMSSVGISQVYRENFGEHERSRQSHEQLLATLKATKFGRGVSYFFSVVPPQLSLLSHPLEERSQYRELS